MQPHWGFMSTANLSRESAQCDPGELKFALAQVLVHKILVITIAASAVVMLAEMRHKDKVLLTVARSLLVGLQGIWFIQIGYIMFRREQHLSCCDSCRCMLQCASRQHILSGFWLCRSALRLTSAAALNLKASRGTVAGAPRRFHSVRGSKPSCLLGHADLPQWDPHSMKSVRESETSFCHDAFCWRITIAGE